MAAIGHVWPGGYGLESYFQEVEMHLRHWGDNVGTAKLSLLSAYHRSPGKAEFSHNRE